MRDRTFQIHCNKLEWLRKSPFGVSSNKIYYKDNNKPEHWVGNSKLRSQDIDDFFKITPKFYEKQASVTGNKEEEENAAKKNTEDADENSEEKEIFHKDKDKVDSVEEEKKTLEYQEILNLDIEDIASTNQKNWRSIYEVTHNVNMC